MAKKCFLMVILTGFLAGTAFALPQFKMSAGGGLYFSGDFGGGVEFVYNGRKLTRTTPYAGGGAFGFFDATFGELSVGYFLGKQTIKEACGIINEGVWSALDFSVLGKYPFTINDKFTVFPLAGVNYRLSLDPQNESALWFKFGGGLDYSLTEKLYIRGEALYGLRLANQSEKEWGDFFDEGNVTPYMGHGLTINATVGYRFY